MCEVAFMQERTVRPYFSGNGMQRMNRALGQSAARIRQVAPGFFRRKHEHLQVLDGKRSGNAPIEMRPGYVAAESAIFVLSMATATGALYSWDAAIAEKNGLKALKEQTLGTEIMISNANGSQWDAGLSFLGALGIAVFFGNRLVRMARAKFGHND